MTIHWIGILFDYIAAFLPFLLPPTEKFILHVHGRTRFSPAVRIEKATVKYHIRLV